MGSFTFETRDAPARLTRRQQGMIDAGLVVEDKLEHTPRRFWHALNESFTRLMNTHDTFYHIRTDQNYQIPVAQRQGPEFELNVAQASPAIPGNRTARVLIAPVTDYVHQEGSGPNSHYNITMHVVRPSTVERQVTFSYVGDIVADLNAIRDAYPEDYATKQEAYLKATIMFSRCR